MMKSMVCALSLLCPILVSAQVESGHGWGVFASSYSPDDGDTGFGLGARIGIQILPSTTLDFRATWYEDVGGDGVDLKVVPLEMALIGDLPVSDRIALTAGGGIGYYDLDASVFSPGGAKFDAGVDSEIGYFGLAGIEITLIDDLPAELGATRTTLFAEVKYQAVNVSEVKRGGLSFDVPTVSLDGLSFNLGFRLRW